ncbi:MAG: L-idonate 5-dehydrogenase [Geminicoccaceae bacterium]|nr:L-idonate 5-dehydrogenase [Geminicoccaceae bacterium]
MTVLAARLHAPHDLRVEPVPIDEPGPGQVSVRLEAGGICGSDLHYYHEGGFGVVRLREPMILGHEVAGRIEAFGPDTRSDRPGLAAGDLVALNPSRACGRCHFCRRGEQRHCTDMRFFGSAMRMPHSQGAFRQRIVADLTQCEPMAGENGTVVSAGEAACAEPLAVCLHALRQAGDIAGRRVLVTGAGPIGVLTAGAARHAGALEIVVTDLIEAPLAAARAFGATRTIRAGEQAEALEAYAADKGCFDVAFECSGAAAALAEAIRLVRPGGTVVQVGLGGDVKVPLSLLVSKETRLVGTFRFQEEFALAARLIRERRIDVRPLITRTFALDEAVDAFAEAGNRERAMKVQLALA